MINQAIILAAGAGVRLKPLTDNCPKPMLDVLGKPLLLRHLESLQKAGIKHVVIHVSYLADYIIEYIADGKHLGLDLNIKYAHSKDLLESGGGIELSLPYLENSDKPFLCLNSDIYTDFNYADLLNYDQGDKNINGKTKLGHLVLVPNPSENPHGDYNISEREFLSKSLEDSRINKSNFDYTYSGIAVYHANLLANAMTSKYPEKYSIVLDINSNLDKISASLYNGVWQDIGSIERYNKINQEYRKSNLDAGLG